jgi:uncharacterized FlaG/YvyC family protein
MMEVQFLPNAPVQGQQTGQQTNASAAANDATGRTVQTKPDNVVTVAGQTEGARNERRRDQSGRSEQNTEGVGKTLEDLRLTSRRTKFEFNSDLNRVFLEVIDTKTDQVVDRIPPEELARLFQEQLKAPKPQGAGPNGAVIDESV